MVTKDQMKTNVEYLFLHLWKVMKCRNDRMIDCMLYLQDIVTVINDNLKYNKTLMLNSLVKGVYGVKYTIASGLIHSIWRDQYVPFDKYTAVYALTIGLIPDLNISVHYSDYCNRIVEHINSSDLYNNIEEFVRYAGSYPNIEILVESAPIIS